MGRFIVEPSSDAVLFTSHFSSSLFIITAFYTFDLDEATLSDIGGSNDTVTVLLQDYDDSKAEKNKDIRDKNCA